MCVRLEADQTTVDFACWVFCLPDESESRISLLFRVNVYAKIRRYRRQLLIAQKQRSSPWRAWTTEDTRQNRISGGGASQINDDFFSFPSASRDWKFWFFFFLRSMVVAEKKKCIRLIFSFPKQKRVSRLIFSLPKQKRVSFSRERQFSTINKIGC